jgi:hypothetical protein
MADMMAKTIAYAKICIAAGGTVRQQTKMFGTENGMNMEMAVRSMCKDVDITGVETVEMKHVTEFGKIRSYALVALPIGNANTMRQAQDARLEKEGMKRTAKEAFKELDGIVDSKPAEAVRSEPQTINLLPVDNEEYKRKRDEALQKPGAVIGQTTVR